MKHLLLECPFCGDPDPLGPTKGDPSGGKSDALYYIECSNCTAEVFGSTPEQAVTGWNTRDAPKTIIKDDEMTNNHLDIPKFLRQNNCIMPRELTAENGAKGLLSGEFKEGYKSVCELCGGDGRVWDRYGYSSECPQCNGYGELDKSVAVSWTTIQEIYKMAVKGLEIQ
jgi:hypothetical protein